MVVVVVVVVPAFPASGNKLCVVCVMTFLPPGTVPVPGDSDNDSEHNDRGVQS